MISIAYHKSLTAGDSTILLRRRIIGVDDGDEGVDLANDVTKEKRRAVFEGAERNNEFTFNLSIFEISYLIREKKRVEYIN